MHNLGGLLEPLTRDHTYITISIYLSIYLSIYIYIYIYIYAVQDVLQRTYDT